MRLARRLAPSVSALLVACVVAAAAVPTGNPAGEPPLDPAGAPPPPFPPGPSTQDVELQCPLTLSQGDPACLNGGVVLTDTGEDNEAGGHCARCWCPAGWAGVLCGQCSADSACEAAGGGRCDTGAVLPPARGAARDGYVHELSCECGSDSGYDDVDGQTNWICSLQKGTTLTLQVLPHEHGDGAHGQLQAVERAGVKSQDLDRAHGMFKFASAGVWAANFTECSWGVQPCEYPLDDFGDCWFYSCKQTPEKPASVACPPPWAEPCPGLTWDTNANCGEVPGGDGGSYYQHHCMTIASPMEESETALQCPQAPREDGSYQCYLFPRENPIVPYIGLQCRVGACLKPPSKEPPSPASPPPPSPPFIPEIPRSLYEPLTLALLAAIVLSAITAAVVLVAVDIRRLRRKASAWDRGSGEGSGGDRRGAAERRQLEALSGEQQEALLPRDWEGGVLSSGYLNEGDNIDCLSDVGEENIVSPHGVVEPVVISWEDICYSAYQSPFKRKRILHRVSAVCGSSPFAQGRRGCLLAVLGPSGAGKTSLMDCLAGRREGSGVEGEVRLNGNLMTAKAMRQMAGYVQQEDVLPGTSTVWEYLWFIASLRLPPSLTEGARERRVSSLLRDLHLEKVAHSFIGDAFLRGLSGGEKRRVSIASELITRPSVIFLDEATTGLDSTNAAQVVDILSGLTSEGAAVVLTIHQPRSDLLALLDRVLLLSGNGQVVYSGPIGRALDFFAENGFRHQGVANPADWMLDVVIKSLPGTIAVLVDAFEASRVAADDGSWIARMTSNQGALPPSRYQSNFWKQLSCLSARLMRNAYRHPFLISLNLLASLVMAVAVAIIFYDTGTSKGGVQNRLGVLFFLLLFLSLMSLSSLPIWHEERLLFRRERDTSTYGTSAYFVAVYLYDILPLRVLPPCFFGLISYQAIGLHPGCAECIFWFVAIPVLANICSATCGMAIGAATSSNATANLVGSLFIMLSMIFGGLMLNKDQIPWWASWMNFASMFNFGYEALAINEFANSPLRFNIDLNIQSSSLPPLTVKGESVLRELAFQKARFPWDVFGLMSIAVVSAAVTYILLIVGDMRKGGLWGLLASHASKARAIVWPLQEDGISRPLSMTRFVSLPAELSVISEQPAVEAEASWMQPVDEGGDGGEGMESLEAEVEAELSGGGEQIPRNLQPDDGSLLRTSLLHGEAEGVGLVSDLLQGPDRPGLQFDSSQMLEGGPAGPGVCLSWEDIRCTVKVRTGAMGMAHREILKGITGVAGSSSPTAVGSSCAALMGPSGAGKTTLLDILAGRRCGWGVSGDVRMSGRQTSPGMRMKMSGYVLQDDILPGASLVLEYLMFHAKLRLPANMPKQKRVQRVMNIIQELGLQKVAHTYIGDAFLRGLSGGEKRRVSIAAELLTRPGVLFLDEPTTGLDSTNAANVVDLLARLASGGVTVMMSLHQPRPDIFRLIKRVTLLSKDGYAVYSGAMEPATEYFRNLGHISPSPSIHVVDYMLDVVIKGSNQEVVALMEAFEASSIREEDSDVLLQMQYNDAMTSIHDSRSVWLVKYEASIWSQLKVLAARQLRNSIRHPAIIALNFGATGFVACLLASIYYHTGIDSTGALQNRVGALFFIILFQTLMSLSSLPLWEQDRVLFHRERSAGAYSTGPYFTSVVLFDLLPLRCVPPLLFVLITYGFIGLRSAAGAIVRFWAILVLSNIAGATLNMAIGAAINSSAVANAVGSIYCLVSILLSGFLRSNEGMPVLLQYVSQVSFVSHAFEALLINEFGFGATGFRFTLHTPGQKDASKEIGFDVTGDEVLRTFGFPHNVTLFGDGCATAGGSLPWRCVFARDVMRLVMLSGMHLTATYLFLKFKRAGDSG